jgi:hypothetical protein
MSRRITDHSVGGLNEVLILEAMDEPGSGGACHHYRTMLPTAPGSEPMEQHINFQNGPLGEVPPNGTSNEAILAVLIDRMRGFQSGKFSCRENAIALTHLEDAMHWLQHRTRQRLSRGVEGTLER